MKRAANTVILLVMILICLTTVITAHAFRDPIQIVQEYKLIYSPTKKTVCIVFDDGLQDQFTNALPILQKYSLKATFAVVPSLASSNNQFYMNWSEVETLQTLGMDVQSHGFSHKNLNYLDNDSLQHEIGGSKLAFRRHGIQTGIFIYPWGQGGGSPTVRDWVRRYYLAARSTGGRGIDINSADRYSLNAMEIDSSFSQSFFVQKVKAAMPFVIIVFHDIGVAFEGKIRYLKENSFTVLTMRDAFLSSYWIEAPWKLGKIR